MKKWMALALVLVTAALIVVVVLVLGTIGRERTALLDRFSSEKTRQLSEAAAAVAEDFRDVADDLRFAGQLVRAADTAGDRERELGALVAVVNHYRAMHVYDTDGQLILKVRDPLLGRPEQLDDFDEDLTALAREAIGRAAGQLTSSGRLAADPSGWKRIFAMALPDRGGAIAVLVDTELLAGRLRALTSDGSTRLVVLGAHGRPLPLSDRELAASPELLAQIAGDARVSRIRLEGDDVVLAVQPIPLPGGGAWQVAAFASTGSLHAHDRTILGRAILGTGAVVAILVGFGVFAVLMARRDATLQERLAGAEALTHVHEKTEKILDNIPAGVLTVSATGLVSATNRVLRNAGVSPGKPVGETFAQADVGCRQLLEQLVRDALADEQVHGSIGQRLQLFSGEGRYSLHAIPLERRFPEARVVVVIDDLSELSELENRLLAAEKHATVGVLAAGIAHEIGTPLGVARARAEYVRGKLGLEHPLSDSTRVIIDQVDGVSRTIRQLLDFARIKPPTVQAVSLTSTVHAVIELLRFEAERRDVRLKAELPDDLPSLAADPDQLQQVLVNLTMNSCDACQAGGQIVVRAGLQKGWVEVVVADDGCGVPEELRHRVFDPFFTTKKRGVGTGLGLTLTAQIVRNHGGKIALDSEPGRGTTVAIRWPSIETSHGANA